MVDMTELPGPFWLVGSGNMAGAMLSRWLDLGIDRSRITVIRPSGTPVAENIRVLTAYPEDEVPSLVMLGMKPQQIDLVAPLLAPLLQPQTILVSILAGLDLKSLKARFPAPRTVVKAMPNMPVRLGKGVTNLFSDSEDESAFALVDRLMRALGLVEWAKDEAEFGAAGMLTGTGPAFLFRFIDALAGAGEAAGLDREQAARLAAATVEGAAALAAASEESPETLADRVASPGGTTRAGLNILDAEETLGRLLRATLEASIRRSREMAEEARVREG